MSEKQIDLELLSEVQVRGKNAVVAVMWVVIYILESKREYRVRRELD